MRLAPTERVSASGSTDNLLRTKTYMCVRLNVETASVIHTFPSGPSARFCGMALAMGRSWRLKSPLAGSYRTSACAPDESFAANQIAPSGPAMSPWLPDGPPASAARNVLHRTVRRDSQQGVRRFRPDEVRATHVQVAVRCLREPAADVAAIADRVSLDLPRRRIDRREQVGVGRGGRLVEPHAAVGAHGGVPDRPVSTPEPMFRLDAGRGDVPDPRAGDEPDVVIRAGDERRRNRTARRKEIEREIAPGRRPGSRHTLVG